MDTEQVGAYWLLISYCWNDITLPDDDAVLMKMARVAADRWPGIWAAVQRCFVRVDDGVEPAHWRHLRLDKERAKQADRRATKQASGQAGGLKSAQKRRELRDEAHSSDQPPLEQMQPLRLPTSTTPSSTSTVVPPSASVDDLYEALVPAVQGPRVTKGEVEQFVAAWNELCGRLPRCLEVTPARADKIKTRLRERSLKTWRQVFERMAASPFMRGDEGGTWIADLNWIIHNTGNAVKVLEGKYDERRSTQAFSARTQTNVDAAQRILDRRQPGLPIS